VYRTDYRRSGFDNRLFREAAFRLSKRKASGVWNPKRRFRMARNAVYDRFDSRTVRTNFARQTNLLPDGTQVWLNYDSRLYYPESFDGNLRSVRLEGEALFNVVRDASKPFRVRTSLMEVEVLGTVFDLKCYEHLDYAELVLVSGSVKATCAGQLPVTLCPDERLVAYRNSKKIDYQAVDANNYNKWMFETQKLDEMRLDAVFVNLEHRYNVEFDIADDVGLEARLTLSLRSEPLEEILDAIALVVPIRYESSGGTIFITRR